MLLITSCMNKDISTDLNKSKDDILNSNDKLEKDNDEITHGSNEKEILSKIRAFLEITQSDNIDAFKEMISASGLIIIRNFVSGNNSRGNNIRYVYSSEEIPLDIKFPVNIETPLILKNLFKNSLTLNANQIPIKYIDGTHFNFSDNVKENIFEPSNNKVWNICDKIRYNSKDINDFEPIIFILGEKEFALTESSLKYNVGSWVIFEKVNNNYYLRAIMDFK